MSVELTTEANEELLGIVYLVYSQLPLNGHLVKADTSLKRTRGVGPCRTSVIYFISLQGGHLSKGVWMTFKQTFVVSELSSESYFIYTVSKGSSLPFTKFSPDTRHRCISDLDKKRF